ncbi:MAG: hypothetical protein K6F30_08470 [Lachnospiraceae bacterium]|nr:hypothetical protein [Lachnospiraceae bacterium]
MKQIIDEYGDVIIDGVAIVLLVGILSACFLVDQGVFPSHVIAAMEPIL